MTNPYCITYSNFIMCHENNAASSVVNSLRPRQNGCHFADDIFKCIFLNDNIWIQINISLKFVPKGPINNIPALVQIMAWRRPGDKPLSEPIMVSLTTHICITRPQWVNHNKIPSYMFIQAIPNMLPACIIERLLYWPYVSRQLSIH